MTNVSAPIKTHSVDVKLSNLLKIFPTHDGSEDFYAVNEIELDIKAGELVTLLGPSGCGKTTTLRMLAGFELPTSGSIHIGADNVTNVPPNKRNVAMVFQSYALFPHLSVFENIAYGLKINNVPKGEVIDRTFKVISLMHLEEFKDRLPSQLSGGQQQRVALARAIVTEPRVLLFDEPLSNLDAKLREYMRDELRKIQQRLGITSLYVTHDQTEAMAISDKVVIMNHGKIQQADNPIDIYTRPNNHFVAGFMGKANFLHGVVKDVKDKKAIINILGQTISVSVNDKVKLSENGPVDCVTRPEFWELSEEGKFNGEITRVIYLGNHVEYEVALGDETITMMDFEHYKHGIKQEGERIKLHLKEECVSLLPPRKEYVKEGLV
ncbi:ABC transporter ATP-binding protein [Chengkuizengella axinellae]|uniref:ABC transporter ATP-binding protein n=1 Tax=Chengkuizengella axinellae TaxID=3064388 RepID=A0ABT9IXE5_9BACL|nr:ABC transporter ATP-binding protein [Chengkuizengella sp. 2205SS18-9]MDP5274046.1 ABC transporter ATP-binding protein [Chengkuizengella sp. 2205SS18-9]